MFEKLKYLFSFKWFYIFLFIVLSIFTFWDEIVIGRETFKIMMQYRNDFNQKSKLAVKHEKYNFLDIEGISSMEDIITYTGKIEYIFFHPIISEKERNIHRKSIDQKKFNNLFITIDEFKMCVQKLYENNYILVNIDDIYKQVFIEGKWKIERQPLKIPKGKKPVILFIDDLSYNSYMLNFASSKLIVDESDSTIKSVIYEDGSLKFSSDSEMIPFLNNFVENHPDFSLNNAKGVISLTGHEGVFGYNTGKFPRKDKDNLDTIRRLTKDIYDAKAVAEVLKNQGWKFACHTYGYINFKNVTTDYIRNDIENWFKYVSNIVGTTNIFVYPEGNFMNEDDERVKYLISNGFNIFCLSGEGVNKDSFKIKDHVNIYRDLVCYETIKNSKKDFYKNFEDVIDLHKITVSKKF